MENQKKEYLFRNYGNESVDVTLKCQNYILDNNFYENSEETNIELLERALINYSVLKLAEWNPNYEKLNIENWDDLSALLEALNNQIITEEDKDGFFTQYTHCILKIYAAIKRNNPIDWKKNQSLLNAYTYITENGTLKEFITREGVPPHEIPVKILKRIKIFN